MNPTKTVWDWLQLLIIPAALGGTAIWFNWRQSQLERDFADRQRQADLAIAEQRREADQAIANAQQQEAALQAYFDRISELLLDKGLRNSKPGDDIRKIARARTLTTVWRMNAVRKCVLLHFLYESGLINKNDPIIDLRDANLAGADLKGLDLTGANLRGIRFDNADLSKAILKDADLTDAYLKGATLRDTDLSRATLRGAYFQQANLKNAVLYKCMMDDANLAFASLESADLTEASLKGAIMLDSVMPPGFFEVFTYTDLTDADLAGANLSGARMRPEHLSGVRWLEGAILPEGAKGSKAV